MGGANHDPHQDENESPDEEDTEIEVDVLPWNRRSVDVFRLCDITVKSGMGGISWHGIASGEILSVCTLLKVPEEEFETVMQNVKFMGNVVSNEFNIRADEARQAQADRRS